MGADTSLFVLLALSGLLGSLGHCLGMCGPLVMMMSTRLDKHGLAAAPSQLLYHAARISVYALLGAAVGSVGGLLEKGGGLVHISGVVSLIVGVGVFLLGLGYIGLLPLDRLEGPGVWLNRQMSRAVKRGGLLGIVGLGAANGLLPCGLVYGALLTSVAAGGPLPGALAMLLFGLGTVPALLVLGVGVGSLSQSARHTLSHVAGGLIVLIGLQLTLRGLAAFDVVNHLHIGKLMLW